MFRSISDLSIANSSVVVGAVALMTVAFLIPAAPEAKVTQSTTLSAKSDPLPVAARLSLNSSLK